MANIFDDRTFDELNAHLDFLEAATRTAVQGVIFISAKGKIFIAGADLHGFTSGPMTDERLGGIIDRGHQHFRPHRRLPVPTVAAIQGVCVGGGLELTLACDWRVACNDSATKLGLPEVQIGILPAWGGSVRLPRLVGLPKALEIILTGKQLAGVPAKKAGLVDDIAYPEGMLSTAEKMHPARQASGLENAARQPARRAAGRRGHRAQERARQDARQLPRRDARHRGRHGGVGRVRSRRAAPGTRRLRRTGEDRRRPQPDGHFLPPGTRQENETPRDLPTPANRPR